MAPRKPHISRRSLFGLNAANFLQAEMAGVIMPVLNAFLRNAGWRYDSLGIATAVGGLGALLFQAPAGWLIDRLSCRRKLFAAAALLIGACFVLLPLVPRVPVWIDSLLFVSGATQTLFGPVLAALALGIAGHNRLNRVMGANQSWNHAGNIAAALLAMALVSVFGIRSIFIFVAAGSLLASGSMLFIRQRDVDERVATGMSSGEEGQPSWKHLLHNRTVRFLFLSIFLFHFANAPILPTVALYVKKLGGSDRLMTATVLTAQVVMVPVAWLAGRFCDRWGTKPVMAIAFWMLPLRIFTYSLARSPLAIVWLQCLDGIGAGIYGVGVAAMSAGLTKGKGGFNTAMGLFATAVAIGGVAGPVLSGALIEHLGFRITFYTFAALAGLSAVVFSWLVPETTGAVLREMADSSEPLFVE